MVWVFNAIPLLEHIKGRIGEYIGIATTCNNYSPVLILTANHVLLVESELEYQNIVKLVSDYNVPPMVAKEIVDYVHGVISEMVTTTIQHHPLEEMHFDVHLDRTGSLYMFGYSIRPDTIGDSTYMPDNNKDTLPFDYFDMANDYVPERLR